MSVQAAKDFIEKIKSDEKVRNQAAAGRNLVELGHEHGFDFTGDEWEEGMRQHRREHPEDGPDTCVVL